jgi:hypothetical protein
MHFSTNFWRKSCSNRGSATRLRVSRRSAPRRRAPPPEATADRGAPSPGSRTPRHIKPPTPRVSPSPRRTDIVRPLYARRSRPTYHGCISAVTPSSPRPRPYLPPAFPPRTRNHRSRRPPRPPWPVVGELARPSFSGACQPPKAPP